jgi:MoaA/NifB/PqqE/SkfB family radical SAM enzyme
MFIKSNELKETMKKIRRVSTRFFEQFVAIKNKNGEKHIFIFGKALKMKNLFFPSSPSISKLINKKRKQYFRSNYFRNIDCIEFCITRKCNYRCEYCNSGCGSDKNDVAKEASEETIKNFIKILAKVRNKSLIKLIGGEPVVYPMFSKLAQRVVKSGHVLEIGTNFSLPNKNFEKICDLLRFDGQLKITASLHLSQVQSVDWFVDKVVSLKKYAGKKMMIDVVSVLTESNFLTLKDARERLLLNGINFRPIRCVVNGKYQHYSTDIENYYIECDSYLPKRREMLVDKNTYGLMCKTGYSFFRTNVEGKVLRCYNENRGLGMLGNINEVVWTLKEPLPCLATKCTCFFPALHDMVLFENWDIDLAKKIEQDLPISINSKR